MVLWCAASGLQSAFDQNPLSEVSIAGATANVEVWVGLRALLGLYPGYGLNQAEELRRQAYAVAAALAGNLRLRARFLERCAVILDLCSFPPLAVGISVISQCLRRYA